MPYKYLNLINSSQEKSLKKYIKINLESKESRDELVNKGLSIYSSINSLLNQNLSTAAVEAATAAAMPT